MITLVTMLDLFAFFSVVSLIALAPQPAAAATFILPALPSSLSHSLVIVGFGFVGLCIGSFLNVVIARLPAQLHAQWAGHTAPHTVWQPPSHCPQCLQPLRAWHLVPVISYLVLKGRCGFCRHAIGWRDPVVELVTAGVFALLFMVHGWQPLTLALAGCAATLIVLSCIDIDTLLLPDALTQPLLWAGLIVAGLGWGWVSLPSALWGAVFGYGLLWLVAAVYHHLTGKEGIGQGDFKLLAALGVWLGAGAVLPVVWLASISGAVVGLGWQWHQRRRRHAPKEPSPHIPFGPFLGGAALLIMLMPRRFLSQWWPW